MLTTEQLLNVFRSSKEAKEIEARHAAAVGEQRDGHAKALRALQSELSKVLPPLAKAEQEARAKVEAAREALEAAEREWNAAIGTRHSAAVRLETQMQQHRKALTDTAPAIVEQFRAEIEAERDQMQKEGPDRIEGTRQERLLDVPAFTCNSIAFGRRLRRLMAILNTEIPALRLLSESEIPAAIEAIRKTIPECAGKWNDEAYAKSINGARVTTASSRELLPV